MTLTTIPVNCVAVDVFLDLAAVALKHNFAMTLRPDGSVVFTPEPAE